MESDCDQSRYCYFEQTYYAFGAQACPLMTLCISIDRLIAIRWFQAYNEFSRTCYVLVTAGSIYSFAIVSCAIGLPLLSSDAAAV